MKCLLILAIAISAKAADSPGLLVKASDGELTVYFIAPRPNVALETNESIHPLLKPTFRTEMNGYAVIENQIEVTFPGMPSVTIDGKECAGNSVTLVAGQRRIRIVASRTNGEPFTIQLPFRSYTHDREPRELKENQSRDLGRQLFEDFNCAACHASGPMPYRFTPLPDAGKTKPLRMLHPTEGCLSETPEPNVPQFQWTEAQREALQLFVQTPDISPAPLIDFARQSKQFQCADCHSNLGDFSIPNMEEALFEHAGLSLSTNDIAELSRNYAKIRP